MPVLLQEGPVVAVEKKKKMIEVYGSRVYQAQEMVVQRILVPEGHVQQRKVQVVPNLRMGYLTHKQPTKYQVKESVFGGS